MGFSEAIRTCFAKYFVFSGRAGRSEFWWFYLFQYLLIIAALFVAIVLQASNPQSGTFYSIGELALIFVLVLTVIPYFAVQARRLHDARFPGLLILLDFIGLGIAPFIICFFGSEIGENRYGPEPSTKPVADIPAADSRI